MLLLLCEERDGGGERRGRVGGRRGAARRGRRERYLDAVRADGPVEVGRRVLEVRQERYPFPTTPPTYQSFLITDLGEGRRIGEGREGDAPAFEGGQLAQLDLVETVIAEPAQERVLLERRAERLRLERANTPTEARAPSALRARAVPARVPRHKERARIEK